MLRELVYNYAKEFLSGNTFLCTENVGNTTTYKFLSNARCVNPSNDLVDCDVITVIIRKSSDLRMSLSNAIELDFDLFVESIYNHINELSSDSSITE